MMPPSERTWLRIPIVVLASGALLLPCLWQRRIQAGDFSSHVYNAWLAEQVEAGKVEGLRVESQRTNVLFDLALSFLARRVGLEVGQKAAACLLVVVFAWGGFVLASVEAGRPAWWLLAPIAILAYGWVFHAGFANFYLALGLSLWALALVWKKWTPGRAAAAAALLAAAAVGHILPAGWAASAAAYGWMWRRLNDRGRIVLGVVVLAGILALRFLLMSRFRTLWALEQAFGATGADQAWIYRAKYFLVSALLLLLWTLLLVRRIDADGGRPVLLSPAFQIYLFTAAMVVLIPTRVELPGYQHALVYISHRMSLPAAIMICVSLAGARPARRHAAGLLAAAALFFSFLFVDTRALNRLEGRLEAAAGTLPPNQRVVSALCEPATRLDPLGHMLDRVCAGRCFSYANYEASTTQFRVRAAPGNRVVVSDYGDSYALQTGTYVVREQDLPLYEVYFCGKDGKELCVRALTAGERSGRTCRMVTPILW